MITALIAFGAGFLFNINHYLPMILNIGLCVLCFLLSLTMRDISKYDKIPEVEVKQATGKMSRLVYIAILSYAFFYTAVNLGQNNSKLLIQYELGDAFDTAKTASLFSLIISLSRIARIVSNVLFDRLYRKWKDKINIVLTVGLVGALLLVVIGDCIQTDIRFRMGIMASGFFIILAVRDPFKIYIQNLILRVAEPGEQQAIFAHLELGKKIGTTVMGFVVSAVLLRVSIIWVIVGATVISLMTLKTTIRLWEVVKKLGRKKSVVC